MTKIRFNEFMIHKSQNLKVEKLVYNNKPCQINAFALHILTLVQQTASTNIDVSILKYQNITTYKVRVY